MITKIRTKPRRGRVVDADYMEWVRLNHLCLLWDRTDTQCSGLRTLHHVRRHGEPKNDRRVVLLCQAHHLYDFGPDAIERLGKKRWQDKFHIDLEFEIERSNRDYRELQCYRYWRGISG